MKNIKSVIRSKFNSLKSVLFEYKQFRCLHRSNIEPIFVYQMGKVASSSIYNSLKMAGFCVFHAHVLNYPKDRKIPVGFEQSINYGKKLRRRIIDSGIPLKIITLVRDPVARNISAYFQNLDALHNKFNSHEDVPMSSLISTFIDNYSHDIPLTWFDRELFEVTGIDVYEFEFPKEKKYMVLTNDHIQLLIMAVELDDEVKNQVVGEFVGCSQFSLKPFNISSSKKYSYEYKRFLGEIRLSKSYVESLLNSKYSKHFYSDNDLLCFKERWVVE